MIISLATPCLYTDPTISRNLQSLCRSVQTPCHRLPVNMYVRQPLVPTRHMCQSDLVGSAVRNLVRLMLFFSDMAMHSKDSSLARIHYGQTRFGDRWVRWPNYLGIKQQGRPFCSGNQRDDLEYYRERSPLRDQRDILWQGNSADRYDFTCFPRQPIQASQRRSHPPNSQSINR